MMQSEWGITTHFLWPLSEAVEQIYLSQFQSVPMNRIDFYRQLKALDFEYGCEAIAAVCPDAGDRIRLHGAAILDAWGKLESNCSIAVTANQETAIVHDAIQRVINHNRLFGGHDELAYKYQELLSELKRFVPILQATANLVIASWLTDERLIHINSALSDSERLFFRCLVEAGNGVWVN